MRILKALALSLVTLLPQISFSSPFIEGTQVRPGLICKNPNGSQVKVETPFRYEDDSRIAYLIFVKLKNGKIGVGIDRTFSKDNPFTGGNFDGDFEVRNGSFELFADAKVELAVDEASAQKILRDALQIINHTEVLFHADGSRSIKTGTGAAKNCEVPGAELFIHFDAEQAQSIGL